MMSCIHNILILNKYLVKQNSTLDNVKSYWTESKSNAKAILNFKIGALKYKENWKRYNSSQHRDNKCLVKDCDESDNMNHVRNCKGYDTKLEQQIDIDDVEYDELAVGEYLVKLNRERITKYKMPLF